MNELDISILETALEWLRAGRRVVAVTVADTWGSSPRPAGSMLVWADDGRFAGSVSGGCIEDELLAEFERDLPSEVAVRDYGVSAERAASRGLPCGGRLSVVIEPLGDDHGIDTILEALARRQRLQRSVDLRDGAVSLGPAADDARTSFDGERLSVVFEAKWRMLIIGAGQLSHYVYRFATMLGYDTAICDPRDQYREAWPDDPKMVRAGMPDDFVRDEKPDRQTAIVALTHDPKIDDLAILEALESRAFYVGALGSKRTNASRRKRLKEHFEVSEEKLGFMSGPIGIDLNTRTAAEIALAVIVEITARRNRVVLSSERIE